MIRTFGKYLVKNLDFYGELVQFTFIREIGTVSGKLPDNPGELAYTCLL